MATVTQMTPDEYAKRARLQARRILRDEAALRSYIADGWPLWKIAERHGLKPFEVNRALAKFGIEVPDG